MHADLTLYSAVSSSVGLAGPDSAFAARPRLVRLFGSLTRALAAAQRGRWNEPPAFFFNPARQAELETARAAPPGQADEHTALITAELPFLLASVELRRVARALGLAAPARALAPRCAAARDLADLLAVPDDEVFLALAPAERTGVRLYLRGAADVAQLHRLLAPLVPPRDFQLFAPAALRSDGTLPHGFDGCASWLWPSQPLCCIPRVNGERVVLIGPATVRPAPNVEPRFPLLSAECEAIETLNPFQTTDLLVRLCGTALPVLAGSAAGSVARAA
jgi:hypothetical protein